MEIDLTHSKTDYGIRFISQREKKEKKTLNVIRENCLHYKFNKNFLITNFKEIFDKIYLSRILNSKDM